VTIAVTSLLCVVGASIARAPAYFESAQKKAHALQAQSVKQKN